jgi:hypothetical protein
LQKVRGISQDWPPSNLRRPGRASSGEHIATSYADYGDLREGSKLLDGIAVIQPRPLNIGEGVRAQRGWFDVLRVTLGNAIGNARASRAKTPLPLRAPCGILEC